MSLAKWSWCKLPILAALALATILTGCRGGLLGSPAYRDVHYFSLQTPNQAGYRGFTMEVSGLRMLAAGRNKMVYRDASCEVLVDDYNKWVQSPSFLIRQHIQTFFGAPPNDATDPVELTLKGSVVVFEINRQTQNATLGVEYTIASRNDASVMLQNSVMINEPLNGDTPELFAAAMSRAADKLCATIAKDATIMQQRIKAEELADKAEHDALAPETKETPAPANQDPTKAAAEVKKEVKPATEAKVETKPDSAVKPATETKPDTAVKPAAETKPATENKTEKTKQ